MLRAYPSRSEAWELSVAAKCLADDKYDPSSDLEFLKKCPDYKYIFAPDPDGAIRRITSSNPPSWMLTYELVSSASRRGLFLVLHPNIVVSELVQGWANCCVKRLRSDGAASYSSTLSQATRLAG